MLKTKRWMIVCALSLCLFLGGCVYLRLLDLKNQLDQFDDYFTVEVTDSFTLHAKKPILYDSDILYITELDPSRIESQTRGKNFVYQFFKVNQNLVKQAEDHDIIFTISFDPDKKMKAVVFSPIILQIVPAEFLALSIRAIGKGKVDTRKRQLKGEFDEQSKKELELPTYDRMISVLGTPYDESIQPDGIHSIFRYQLETASTGKSAEHHKKAVLDLLFDPTTKNLLKLSGNFAGMKISIKYSEMIKQPVTP